VYLLFAAIVRRFCCADVSGGLLIHESEPDSAPGLHFRFDGSLRVDIRIDYRRSKKLAGEDASELFLRRSVSERSDGR